MFSSKSHPIVWQLKIYFMILVGILDHPIWALDVPHSHIKNIIFKTSWLKHTIFHGWEYYKLMIQKNSLKTFVVFYQKMGISGNLNFLRVNLTNFSNFWIFGTFAIPHFLIKNQITKRKRKKETMLAYW